MKTNKKLFDLMVTRLLHLHKIPKEESSKCKTNAEALQLIWDKMKKNKKKISDKHWDYVNKKEV